jgi:hypothetical protein
VGNVVVALVLDRGTIARLLWSLRLLYQSTQPAVAYSTSARVFERAGWKTVVRMHSAL